MEINISPHSSRATENDSLITVPRARAARGVSERIARFVQGDGSFPGVRACTVAVGGAVLISAVPIVGVGVPLLVLRGEWGTFWSITIAGMLVTTLAGVVGCAVSSSIPRGPAPPLQASEAD